jgi:hypothetical protein
MGVVACQHFELHFGISSFPSSFHFPLAFIQYTFTSSTPSPHLHHIFAIFTTSSPHLHHIFHIFAIFATSSPHLRHLLPHLLHHITFAASPH